MIYKSTPKLPLDPEMAKIAAHLNPVMAKSRIRGRQKWHFDMIRSTPWPWNGQKSDKLSSKSDKQWNEYAVCILIILSVKTYIIFFLYSISGGRMVVIAEACPPSDIGEATEKGPHNLRVWESHRWITLWDFDFHYGFAILKGLFDLMFQYF